MKKYKNLLRFLLINNLFLKYKFIALKNNITTTKSEKNGPTTSKKGIVSIKIELNFVFMSIIISNFCL